ncbi:hypothetical protein CCACVL1_17876, partial [Corchorus capsularis]
VTSSRRGSLIKKIKRQWFD